MEDDDDPREEAEVRLAVSQSDMLLVAEVGDSGVDGETLCT